MNLYQEKLQQYEEADKAFRMAEETLKRKRDELFKYVEENIISKDYTIGYKKMDDGHELYYPILSLPEGYEIHTEEFVCSSAYSEYHGESYPVIYHEYVLSNRKENLDIYVLEKATKSNIEYFNTNIQLEIKNKTLVMDYVIKYIIKIGEMKFEFHRNFKGDIIFNRLTDILKNKYICYSDFDEISHKQSRMRRYGDSKYKRHCVNKYYNVKMDWKKVLVECLERIVGECETDKILEGVEENLPKITSFEYIIKIYRLNKENSLIVLLSEYDSERECIAYEDEQLILEIPVPIRCARLDFFVINKEYQENLEEVISNDDIKDKDFFFIRMNNDLDMNKKMYVLDILDEFKDKN